MKVYKFSEPLYRISHDLRFRNDQGFFVTIASDELITNRLYNKYQLYDYLIDPTKSSKHMEIMCLMLRNVADEWHNQIIELYKTTLYDYNPIENYDRTEEGGWIDEHHKGSKSKRTLDTKESSNSDYTTVNTPNLTTTTTPNLTTTNTPATTDTNVHKEAGYNDAALVDTSSDALTRSGTDTTKETGTNTVTATGTSSNRTTGSDEDNYTARTGTDTVENTDISATVFDNDKREFNNYRVHGNIGVMSTQDMIQKQRDIIIDILDIYVSKFAECFDISSFIAFEPIE